MSYWIDVWNKPRAAMTIIDELAVWLQLLIVVAAICGLIWIFGRARK